MMRSERANARLSLISAAALVALSCGATDAAAATPNIRYHLTARPWVPLNLPRGAYLDRIEGVVRYIGELQDADGAIIEPGYIEYQQATPYFANALGTLLAAGRANDLLDRGVAAMDHVSSQMAIGNSALPQQHGNFFVAPMADALSLYKDSVSAQQLVEWEDRMKLPIDQLVLLGPTHNWRTYAMKGEWYRAKKGLVSTTDATSFIEDSWLSTQRNRLVTSPARLYRDTNDGTTPEAFAYDVASRSELWGLIAEGYDGPSAPEIERFIKRAATSALILQDASGQAPFGGRSAGMTWNDVYMGLNFELMAEQAKSEGQSRLAGQYRHAAMMALKSTDRWRSSEGFYFVAKNRFEPWMRVGYPVYAALTNYNGFVMYHMAEAYQARKSDIKEQPTPVEIGGYADIPDATFGVAVANAGGMQVQVAFRGTAELDPNQGQYWTKLGLTRFSRVGWDSRLGPSDGVREPSTGAGVSFAPTFLDGPDWIRMAEAPTRYHATFSAQFKHPLLVRCRIDYEPRPGNTGPTFRDDLVITPDGVFSTVTSSAGAGDFGINWPLFVADGQTTLNSVVGAHIASTAYPGAGDQQNFIALDDSAQITALPTVRGTYGDVQPLRVVGGSAVRTFVYPRSASDPGAASVRASFTRDGQNFSTLLGRVEGSLYVGRTSAGGFGTSIDLDGDGTDDVQFNHACGFILRLKNGAVRSVETDRTVNAVIGGRSVSLAAYAPKNL